MMQRQLGRGVQLHLQSGIHSCAPVGWYKATSGSRRTALQGARRLCATPAAPIRCGLHSSLTRESGSQLVSLSVPRRLTSSSSPVPGAVPRGSEEVAEGLGTSPSPSCNAASPPAPAPQAECRTCCSAQVAHPEVGRAEGDSAAPGSLPAGRVPSSSAGGAPYGTSGVPRPKATGPDEERSLGTTGDERLPMAFSQGKTDYRWKRKPQPESGEGGSTVANDYVPFVAETKFALQKQRFYFGMPQGYPHTCAPGYKRYFFISISSSFVSNFSSSIGYQTLLNGFFLESSPQLWMLKDLIPALLAAFLANKIVSYENRPKFWFVVSVVMSNASVITDMMIPHFFQNHYYYFFFAAITTSIVKQSSALMFFVARASALQHFAINRNLAELTKKFNSFGMVVYTIATASGIVFTYFVTSIQWQVATVVTCCMINFILAPLSMSNIAFRVLNQTTMPMILREYILSAKLPPPAGGHRLATVVFPKPLRIVTLAQRAARVLAACCARLGLPLFAKPMGPLPHSERGSQAPPPRHGTFGEPSAAAPTAKVPASAPAALMTSEVAATPLPTTSSPSSSSAQWTGIAANTAVLRRRARRVPTPEEISKAMGIRMVDRFKRLPNDRTSLLFVSPAIRDLVIHESTLADDVLFVSHSGTVSLALWEVADRAPTWKESWQRWDRPVILPRSLTQRFSQVRKSWESHRSDRKSPPGAAAPTARPPESTSPAACGAKRVGDPPTSAVKHGPGKRAALWLTSLKETIRQLDREHHIKKWKSLSRDHGSRASATPLAKPSPSATKRAWQQVVTGGLGSKKSVDAAPPVPAEESAPTALSASKAARAERLLAAAKSNDEAFGRKRLVLLVQEHCDSLHLIMVYLIAYNALLSHATTERELCAYLRKCHAEQELWRVRAMELMNALLAANWDTELLGLDPPDFRLSSLIIPRSMRTVVQVKDKRP